MATCYVTCPAYSIENPAKRARVLDGIQPVAAALGWEVVLSPQLERFVAHGGWLPAAERIADIRRALEHDVVWACVGGYGSAHLVEALMAAEPARPPRLIGYSDITVLHACWRVRGWGEGIYTAVPAGRGRTRDSIVACARGEAMRIAPASEAGVRVLRTGRASGRLHPACVSVLAGLVGTVAMPDLDGAILAVEDIGEQPFQIDFALWQLQRAGHLAGVRGLVGGAFQMKERVEPYGPSFDEVLAEWAQNLGVPAVTRVPFGHIDDGIALPVGRMAELRAEPGGDWGLTVLPRGEARSEARDAGSLTGEAPRRGTP
jgi:muramoyltetrapeptide carboxypeptidase